MTKSKTFLLGGVVLLLASSVSAGQRSRGGESVRGGGIDLAAHPDVQELAPGVAKRTAGSVDVVVNSQNSIAVDDVVAEFGSLDMYQVMMATADVQSYPDPNDPSVSILANNALILVAGFAPESELPKSLAEHVESHKLNVAHDTMVVGNHSALVFADGAMAFEPEQMVLNRTGVPTTKNGDSIIAADNAIEP